MKTTNHISIIWAIARKDIAEAIRDRLMVSLILGVFVLVGSSQIGVLLQQLSDTHLVYIYDTTGHELAYSPDAPKKLNFVPVASDDELSGAVLNNLGTAVGLKIMEDEHRQSLTTDVTYAHWANRETVDSILSVMEPFLRAELGDMPTVRLSQRLLYPESVTNRVINSLALTSIIALFAFCGSLVPTLMVEEKRRKTMEVLLISPASIGDIIGGKAFAGAFYGVLTSCVTAILLSRYILHWEIAALAFFLGTMLAVVCGLLLGALLNSYHTINVYSAGFLFLLFLPLVPDLLGIAPAEGFASLLRLFPIPALMTLTQMIFLDSIALDLLVLNAGVLITSAVGIGLLAMWVVTHTNG